MNYIEPILYVAGDDEIFILNHAKENRKEDFDVMIRYDYQKKHFELLNNYIAPEYYKLCPDKQKFFLEYEIEEVPYGDFFKYFYIKYLQEKKIFKRLEFKKWLDQEHPLYVKERNVWPLRYYELKR